MNTRLLQTKSKKYIFLVSSLFLLSAVPYFAGSGLDRAEPLDRYLNLNFPATLPQGLPYVPVYTNLTFDSPLTFNEVPTGNKIIIGQRDGRIYWFDKVPNVSTKNMLLDLSAKVGVVWDGGFLGLALHPKFGTPGFNYFYTWYTTEDANSNDFPNMYTTQSCNSEEYWGNFLVLARYEADPNTLNTQESSEQILLKLRMYGTTHRGGGLVFGDDGFLYLTTGDQTAFKKSQDITNNLDGGVLRLDVDRDSSKSHAPVRTMPADHGFSDEITGNGYWIPNDNPFLSPDGASFEEYYSLGHRNPHRMTKDRATGALYVGEIGGGLHEEINVIKKGKNYGWPLYEGLFRSTFCVPALLNNMAHEEPLTIFPRAVANAIIGGYVYRGSEIPELQGRYICADYGSGEEIFSVDIDTGSYNQLGNFSSTNIISFGEDNDAELYIMKQGVSTLFKLVSKDNPVSTLPKFLSQTGAFKNLNTLEPTDGLIPYDLIESFWSDGATKKRWLGIPNNGSHNSAAEQINYSADDVWNFPIGSVLVKHFELPLNENNPSITKRLETRFSIKASNGNFYFVTYKWNDQQTDAEILTSGLDETINITKADGTVASQKWRYPDNSECITCHNPSSGGTLGTRTRYLNKDYTYPKTGRTGNQLVTLSHLGILDRVITDADTGSLLTSKSIDDATASLDEKARSYLDLNCAYCHSPGTGNRGGFDLRLKLSLSQTQLLTAPPYLSLGIPNEKIVDPGNPATSILYHRANSTDPAIMMPPLAKNKLDAKAIQLLNDWISQLEPDACADRIIMETFDNVPGTTIAELKSSVNFPNSPSRVNDLNEFRIPINVADDYGVRVKGILKAPETGTFYFWVSGDDNVELSLSSDATEGNKTRIAFHNNWSNDGEWNKFPTQKSAGIPLVAGRRYYIEALMNERGGGDNLSVGWRKPSDGNGTVPAELLPCEDFDKFSAPVVVRVSDVVLAPTTISLEVGNTTLLSATVSPENAVDKTVTWSSSNDLVALVDATGKVTAIAEGNATITVRTNDGGYVKTASVTVVDTPTCVVIQEYRINGEWDSGAAEITVNQGDNVFVSMLPNDIGVDIKGPNGRYLQDFDLGAITPAQAGTYTIISEFGCSETLVINVIPDGCPIAGTPCDDNDPTTEDDVEDGNCNCSGNPTATQILCVSIDRGSDDVEQSMRYTNTSIGSRNIQLIADEDGNGGDQTVGLRFNNIAIPAGAIVESAYLQFTVDEVSTMATSLSIRGEAADNPETFKIDDFNVTARPVTSASVTWNPPNWNVVGASGTDQRSPNLASIVQELVSRPGFRQNSSMAFIIRGTGKRTAVAFEEYPAHAAELCIIFSPGPSSFKARLTDNLLESIEEAAIEVALFPNPTSGLLTLDLVHYQNQALQCTLFSSAQQQVFEKRFDDSHEAVEILDLSELADGVYTLMIQNEKGTLSKKVVLLK
ncbi:MAG: PQQ-dependent sugar dehydrogenase [Flavobacteriaceae bacterium]